MKIKKLILAIALPWVAGAIGSIATFEGVRDWYPTLIKPWFTPPSWVFGPVWTTLYLMMGVAFYLVLTGKKSKFKASAQKWFVFQLFLNAGWSVVFFAMRNLWLASIEIVVLWLAILMTIWQFRKVSSAAALLLVPYILWVTLASFLTFGVFFLN